MSVTSKITTPNIPTILLVELERRSPNLNYTTIISVFQVLQINSRDFIGVCGDGDNGAYEWFTFYDGVLETSDYGYGSPMGALGDVLKKELQ